MYIIYLFRYLVKFDLQNRSIREGNLPLRPIIVAEGRESEGEEGARDGTLGERWGTVAFAAKRWKYWNRRNMTPRQVAKRNETMFALRGTSRIFLSPSFLSLSSLSLPLPPSFSSSSRLLISFSRRASSPVPAPRTEDLLISSAF